MAKERLLIKPHSLPSFLQWVAEDGSTRPFREGATYRIVSDHEWRMIMDRKVGFMEDSLPGQRYTLSNKKG